MTTSAAAPGPAEDAGGLAGEQRRRISIFARILLAFLAVSTTTSVILITITYAFNTDSIEKHARSSITQQLETINGKFDQAYRRHLDRSLRWLSSSPLLDDYLFSSSAESAVAMKRLERLFQRTVDDSEGFDAILFIDFDGNVQINTERRRRDGMRVSGRESRLADPEVDEAVARLFERLSGEPMLLSSGNMEWFMPPREMQVEGPVFDAEGKLFALIGIGKLDHDTADFGGIVAVRLSLEPLLEELREISFFDMRPLWLFDSTGRNLQRPPDRERSFDPRPYLSEDFQGQAKLEYVAEGLVAYEDFAVEPGRTFVRIVAAVPSSALHRDTVRALVFFGVVLLASVVFVLIASLYVSRYLTRPIVELAGAATRLAKGELGTRVGFSTTGEVQTLVDSFNQMAEDLRQTMDARDASVTSLEREVGERKRAEAELKRHAEELMEARVAAEGADRAKSEFIATMSHEIRTPINGVLGTTELMLSTELDPRQSRLARTTRRSVLTLLDIINDILDFSKIEAGKLELAEEDFDLRELVEDVSQMLAGNAHRKGIELACAVPQDVAPRFRGDEARLRQILLNLLGNAVKFTDAGEVVVRVERLGERDGHRELRFEVRDTGIGIAEGALRRIFDAFSQADGSTTRRFGGTGLGLGISQRLVELMGGSIGVESELGVGSRFWFTLPLRLAEPRTDDSADATPMTGRRILVVDDSATQREILAGQLESLGAAVERAPDGRAALGRLLGGGERFDVVLVDQQMPAMGGAELVGAVRGETSLGATKLVLLGADGGDAPASAPDATLLKPVRQSELLACLRAILAGQPYEDARSRDEIDGEEQLVGRVLIAEDNPVNQELAAEMIELLGAEPVVANDGIAALELMRQTRFDLVLMDCQMPRMDGFEATRSIRALEAAGAARTPVVALTANAFATQRERCLRAGMDDYLTKPFLLEELRAVVSRWLEVRSPAAPEPPAAPPPAESPAPHAGALDPRAIANIRSLQREGADDVLERYARLYFQTSEELIARLRAGVGNGDAIELNDAAHALKSASANIGASDLAAACRQLETLTERGETSGADELLAQIEIGYEQACVLLERACEDQAA